MSSFHIVGGQVSEETVKQSVKISNEPYEIINWIQELSSLGFEQIILHNVNKRLEQFIDFFGAQVLSGLSKQP